MMDGIPSADDTSPMRGGQTGDPDVGNRMREAVVVFSTDLPEKFRIPGDPYVVPAHFERLHLSQLINQLLDEQVKAEYSGERWHHQPFDFLIDGELFLRTSLHEYMTSHGLTAEVTLQLQYQLAVRRLREQHLPSSRDWIASLSSVPREGLLVEASYDGSCRVHHLPGLSSGGSPVSTVDSKPGFVTQLPLSSTLVGLSLRQGPLGAAAAFAGGAYMPSGCLQVLLGSKGGGYNVVHMWEEQQQKPEEKERNSTRESEIPEESGSAGADAGSYGRNRTVVVNPKGTRNPGDETFKRRTIGGAALNAVGCQGSEVTCLDVSNDGVTAASGGADGKVLLWDNVPDMKDAATQHQEREDAQRHSECYNSHSRGVIHDLASSKASNESFFATKASVSAIPCKRKRVARKASVSSSSPPIRAKEPKLVLDGHRDRVSDLCFPAHPLRCVLYTSSLDETICGWDTLVGGAPLSVWTTSCPVTSMSCSPVDGTVVCSAHVDGRLRLWDIRSGTVAASINDTDGGGGQASNERQGDLHSTNSGTARLEAGVGTAPTCHGNSGKKLAGTGHVTLSANSRLDRRLTFGSVPDRRATTRARWCPVKEGEYWIATVSQDGMLRLRDLRAPTMPLFSTEVCGMRSDGHAGRETRRNGVTEITQGSGEEKVITKGPPVRLLSCCWLDGNRIVTGGSDGVIRVFTVGATELIEQTL